MRPVMASGPTTRGLAVGASGVKERLTSVRPTRVVENDEYTRFVCRIVRAFGRRIAAGDIENLHNLVQLEALANICARNAVAGLRREGFSWAEIADRLGVTRQAAQQRWGADS